VNGGTLWYNTNDTITIGVTNIFFASLNVSITPSDKFVKVTINDTTEKYLQDAIANAIVVS
jgi:hypothetical protein